MGRLESRTERSEGGGVAVVCGARSAERKRAVTESPHAHTAILNTLPDGRVFKY